MSFSICMHAGRMSISSAVAPTARISCHAWLRVRLEVAKPGDLDGMAARGFGESVLPHAIGQQPVEIDVGERELRSSGEALRFGEQGPVLVDDRVAVPGEISGGLANACRAVQVGRQAAR